MHKSNPFIDLLVSIIIPSVILMKFSSTDGGLGATGALLAALAFPVSLGLYELLRFRKTNYIALLGLISVLLTGGIGLLELDAQWLAVKEAAIPAVIGLAVLISARLGYPLIRVLLYNEKIFNTEKIAGILEQRGFHEEFDLRLLNATYYLSATFFFSAVMNYILATWIVTSQSGSVAFNEELGKLTLVSYPMIAIPSMIMMLAIFYFVWRSIHNFTGLKLEDVLAPGLAGDDKE